MESYLSGWRICRSNISDDGGEVLGPEGAFALPVIPEGRRVLGRVQGQVLQNLALFCRCPMNAKNILRSWISKRKKRQITKLFLIFLLKSNRGQSYKRSLSLKKEFRAKVRLF